MWAVGLAILVVVILCGWFVYDTFEARLSQWWSTTRWGAPDPPTADGCYVLQTDGRYLNGDGYQLHYTRSISGADGWAIHSPEATVTPVGVWSPEPLASVDSNVYTPPEDGWTDGGGCARAGGEWDSESPVEVNDPWWGCDGVEVTGLGPCAGTGSCPRQAPAALVTAALLAVALG